MFEKFNIVHDRHLHRYILHTLEALNELDLAEMPGECSAI